MCVTYGAGRFAGVRARICVGVFLPGSISVGGGCQRHVFHAIGAPPARRFVRSDNVEARRGARGMTARRAMEILPRDSGAVLAASASFLTTTDARRIEGGAKALAAAMRLSNSAQRMISGAVFGSPALCVLSSALTTLALQGFPNAGIAFESHPPATHRSPRKDATSHAAAQERSKRSSSSGSQRARPAHRSSWRPCEPCAPSPHS